MSNIGIRLANGEFYSILDDTNPAKKRVTLTTVQDDQRNVQIDILRKAEGPETSEYVGTLLLEDLDAQPGNPIELELVLGVDDAGTISARLGDTQGSQYQSFSIASDQIEQQEPFGLPDFDTDFEADIDSIEDFDDSLTDSSVMDEDQAAIGALSEDDAFPDFSEEMDAGVEESLAEQDQPSDFYNEQDRSDEEAEDQEAEEPPRPFQPMLLVAIILVTLSVLGFGAYLVFTLLQSDALPALTGQAGAFVPLLLVLPRRGNRSA